jgi:AAA+ superfamily predicted ATPase
MKAAVEAAPEDVPLRMHFAELLSEASEHGPALEQFAAVLARDPAHLDALRGAAQSAKALGEMTRASGYRRLLEALQGTDRPISLTPQEPKPRSEAAQRPQSGTDEAPPAMGEAEWNRLFGLPGEEDRVPVRSEPEIEEDEWEAERPAITLADVGGMAEVKRRLNTAFLAPLRNPELMKMYGKSLRGGLLLYGPPGCGKTFIARALAGELGAKFMSVGLADVLDMWLGESEKRLQQLFDTARRNAPSVLFFDEIDALGQKRSHLRGGGGRNVVNQLLTELDSIGGNNAGVFVLAATNHPWDVDTALRRPGRFDRLMLVLPPDEPARAAIIRYHLKDRPADEVDTGWIASRTAEYSGADLAHLCESAVEAVLEEAIAAGRPRPLTTNDFKRVLKEVRPSTRPWFEIARNFAMFANEGGMYDELLAYIKAHKI